MSREEDNWHLSRSVPITLIFGLIAQAAAIVWTVSMMMSDIERNAEEIMRMQSRLSSCRRCYTKTSSIYGPYR